ncbi:MAG: c-type cytochrome [Planctomycetes bacterium]|jgi:mono/diheme cytochrome c family protein|nr:c-type cytochrome [Planctomycetota bacterium]
MMVHAAMVGVVGWLCATAWLSFGVPQDPAPTAAASRLPGAKVTFERRAGADADKQVHSQRARLLSLAVERGETATPFVPPGMFRATYRSTLTMPARDRCNFRIEGRGSVQLTINGDKVLDGALRAGKPLQTEQPARLKKGDNELVVTFDSLAMGDGQFRLFWSGTDFGFEPIAPERLSVAGDAELQAGEQLRLGQQLFADRRCARCHEPDPQRIGESAFGELDHAGPDLRTIGARTNAGWLAAWLRDPRAIRPDATMPKFALTAQDAADLALWLAGSGAPLASPPFPAEAAATGRTRFRERGCVACHRAPDDKLPEPAGTPLGDRIDLGFVAGKWQPQALVAYLKDPRADYRHVRMPDLKLSNDDAQVLAAYLLSGTHSPLAMPTGSAERGRKLAQKHNCAICHALDAPVEDRGVAQLRSLKPERGCLADAPGSAPDHGFTAAQREAVRAFLPHAEQAPFRRAPLDFAQRHLVAERCTACHALDGRPSTWAQWVERESKTAALPKEQDPIAQGVPALTWTGGKLQPGWIERFVTGNEKSPRPWLVARMPAFADHGAAIAQGIVREHGYGPQDEPPVPAQAQLAIHGERLLAQGTGFGCVQCHALGDRPATQVFEREGIELGVARARLRHEYYTRWLADPPRLDPDSRMPKYADSKGKTAFTEVLGGDARQQFEAIWQFLGSRMPAPR